MVAFQVVGHIICTLALDLYKDSIFLDQPLDICQRPPIPYVSGQPNLHSSRILTEFVQSLAQQLVGERGGLLLLKWFGYTFAELSTCTCVTKPLISQPLHLQTQSTVYCFKAKLL